MYNLKNIAKWNNFNFKLVNTAFLLKGETAEEKIASFDKIIYDHRIHFQQYSILIDVKRDKSWTTLDKRSSEIKKPGKERTIYASNQKRRADRQQMAFYCKYVLGKSELYYKLKRIQKFQRSDYKLFFLFIFFFYINMKQSEELGNPFKECQMYVADLADPLTLVEFLEEITPIRVTKQLEPLNKTQQMNPKPPKTANPYQSDWANAVLKEQFQVEVQMVSQRNGTKWVIKKLKDSDSAESEPKMSRQEMKSQEKLFSHTASQSNRKKLTKFINQYRKSYNGSIIEKKPKQRSDLFEYITPMPIFDINFQKKYLPNI